MIKSYHDFYSKKLKYADSDSNANDDEETEIDTLEQPNKISKINSTSVSNASASSLDEDSSSQSSASPNSQDSLLGKQHASNFSALSQYGNNNFPSSNNFYNSSESGYSLSSAFGYHPNSMPGTNPINTNSHHSVGMYNHHPYASTGYNPAFNNFSQQSQFRLNMNQQVKPESNVNKNSSRNSTDSSSDSLNSNSLNSPTSIDENSGSSQHFHGPSSYYANSIGHVMPAQQSAPSLSTSASHVTPGPLLTSIINPSSLLLRVNRPNSEAPPVKKRRPVPTEVKDSTYWEKRKKNNESAKRSRDMKRTKEEQLSMTVVYLEQENLQLRTEVGLLRAETEKMRLMLYPQLRHQQQQQQVPPHHLNHTQQQQTASANLNPQVMLNN
jgi:hypothetical protein